MAQQPGALLLALLVRQTASVVLPHAKHSPGEAMILPKMHAESMGTMPVHLYRADCSLLQGGKSRQRMPGAGMEPAAIEPFKTVLKDGFYQVDCVNDYMFAHGDKFGDNKFQYKLSEVSNVSIVHYNMHVAAEDKKPMTHETCFSFCRTVPGMTFFGIHNGRDCYCTPYYQSVEGDDSMCDAVCEGNSATICGSKTKSSMFGMHMCSSTASDVAAVAGTMEGVKTEMMKLQGDVDSVSQTMQAAAAFYQAKLGQGGDPVAAALMQAAKVEAGGLAESAGRAQKLGDSMTPLKTEADGAGSSDFSSSTEMGGAEELLDKMEAATAKGEATTVELKEMLSSAAPNATSTEDAAKQYYSVMYFVDKKFDNAPSTCGGTAAHAPLVGSLDSCARTCDAEVHSCVGFSYFPGLNAPEEGLCFLMSKLKSATYYTGCTASAALLQHKAHAAPNATAVQCMAKYSKFDGATLKPDPSGKCELCLKEATKADRCVL